MLNVERLNIGIVGAGGRPKGFISAIENSKRARLVSVCDTNSEAMDKAVEGLSDVREYTDYEEMLRKEDLDAVIIGTPMHLHTAQAVAALENNINVFSEVTAAISVDECKKLVKACGASKAQYMMGENCNYMKPYMMIREMIRDGVFGEVYYAEGEYLHNCKSLAVSTPWRRDLLYGVDGITYGTHSLGPILSWFEGDRIVEVSCAGSGHHYKDAKGNDFEQEDTCVMLARTKMGRLIKIRLDIVSNRTYNLKYLLQGTKGCYDSKRFKNEKDWIWTNELCKEENPSDTGMPEDTDWLELDGFEEKYLPEQWRKYGADADVKAHGGADFIIMSDYIDALANGRPVPIDIHKSLDMTLPGLMSQQSILKGGEWVKVPDSRQWQAGI